MCLLDFFFVFLFFFADVFVSPTLDSLIRDDNSSRLHTPEVTPASLDGSRSKLGLLVSPRSPAGPSSSRRSLFGLRTSSQPSASPASDAREYVRTSSGPAAAIATAAHVAPEILGGSLEQLNDYSGSAVPILLIECFGWLRRSGALDSNSVFRGTGDTDRITQIVNAFETNTFSTLDILEPTVEDVCTLLKMFFRSLREPLFTFKLFDDWLDAIALEDLKRLLKRLPSVHFEVLRYVMSFLHELLDRAERNGVTSNFLGTTLGPLLLRGDGESTAELRTYAAEVVSRMLENFQVLFGQGGTRGDEEAESSKKRTPGRPAPPPPGQVKHQDSVDEFASLARLAASVKPARAVPPPPPPAPLKTPEDSEEDMPESSSDEDSDLVPRVAVMGRATIRHGLGGGGSAGGGSSIASASSIFSSPPPPKSAQQEDSRPQRPDSDGKGIPTLTTDLSFSSIDSQVLLEHINHLKEMPLTPKGNSDQTEPMDLVESDEERARKLAEIRELLMSDPHFQAQIRPPSMKYEPAAMAKRKKARRKKKPGNTGSSMTPVPASGSVVTSASASVAAESQSLHPPQPATASATGKTETPRKRRPKFCGKCKEQVRGVKVNALGQAWHPSCFVCTTCGKQLADFFECKQLPYCGDHIGQAEEKAWGLTNKNGEPLCGRCNEVVLHGTIVSALGKKWHSGCFVCTRCQCPLETYFGAGGHPYCEKHVAAATVAPKSGAPGSKAAGSSASEVPPILNVESTPTTDSSGSRRKKKKGKSHRSKRAMSNPGSLPSGGVGDVDNGPVLSVAVDSSGGPSVEEKRGDEQRRKKKSAAASGASTARATSSNVSDKALPNVVAVVEGGPTLAPSVGLSSSSGNPLSPRRYPKKQDAILFYEKAKRRIVKRYAILQDQRFCLYKDEAAARKAKDPLEIFDLTLLKKVSKMGVHMDKPYCLALTVDYETALIWVDMIEYGNWSDALCDSGENVQIGALVGSDE